MIIGGVFQVRVNMAILAEMGNIISNFHSLNL